MSQSRRQSVSTESLFRYTSGRWLCNEEDQLRRRYLQFDVEKLQQVASRVQGSRCVSIRKLQEGSNNKVFSLAFESGPEVIARLPTSVAGHPHWTISSEVATLDFVRNVLAVPTPRVLKWSAISNGQDGIGAEYMLMEHAPGIKLSTVWSSMVTEQHFALAGSLIEIEGKLASNALAHYGSIYFEHDRPARGPMDVLRDANVNTSSYAIAPVMDGTFWSEELQDSTTDRGPWESPLLYFTAVIDREISLLQATGSSLAHVKLLRDLRSILRFILPAREDISRAVLWHLDLHEDNIFVDKDNPSKITSIIDWQNTWAAPLFMQARYPSLVDCPWPYPSGVVMPTLPDGFDNLSEDEKVFEEQKLSDVKLKKYFEIGTRRSNPSVYRAMAMMDDDNDPTTTALSIVSQTRKDGPVPLQELLIQIYEKWNEIVEKGGCTGACPISFTEQEIKAARERAENWAVAFHAYESLRSELLGKDGWVPHEDFAEASRRYEERRPELEVLRKKLEDASRMT